MKVLFDMIEGDYMQNEFMHACDVFEKGKQLGDFVQFTAEFASDDADLNKALQGFKEAIENSKPKRNLIFLSVREIDGVKTNEYEPIIKEGVQTISTGHKWGMFHEMLKQIGYDVKTSEFMEVTEAKLII